MAQKGRIFLFGNGQFQINPIHGEDLAQICVDALNRSAKTIEVGGPEILSQEEIAQIAFDALGKKTVITFIPDWVRVVALKLGRLFMNKFKFGPFEFFMNAMAIDMVGPAYGKQTLYNYFKSLNI